MPFAPERETAPGDPARSWWTIRGNNRPTNRPGAQPPAGNGSRVSCITPTGPPMSVLPGPCRLGQGENVVALVLRFAPFRDERILSAAGGEKGHELPTSRLIH